MASQQVTCPSCGGSGQGPYDSSQDRSFNCDRCYGAGSIEVDDWQDRIDVAKERGRFDDDDRVRAKQWGTCAVGENWNIDPKGPTREDLRTLGEAFNGKVQEDDICEANETLRKIRELD